MRLWTEEEIEQLKELRKTHTYKEIALILDRTPSSIGQKVHHLGLGRVYHKPKCYPPSRVIEHWINSGLSYADVARRVENMNWGIYDN